MNGAAPAPGEYNVACLGQYVKLDCVCAYGSSRLCSYAQFPVSRKHCHQLNASGFDGQNPGNLSRARAAPLLLRRPPHWVPIQLARVLRLYPAATRKGPPNKPDH